LPHLIPPPQSRPTPPLHTFFGPHLTDPWRSVITNREQSPGLCKLTIPALPGRSDSDGKRMKLVSAKAEAAVGQRTIALLCPIYVLSLSPVKTRSPGEVVPETVCQQRPHRSCQFLCRYQTLHWILTTGDSKRQRQQSQDDDIARRRTTRKHWPLCERRLIIRRISKNVSET
jgi:hypothetical protein